MKPIVLLQQQSYPYSGVIIQEAVMPPSLRLQMLTAMNDKVRSIDRHMQALEQRESPLPVAVQALGSDIDGMIAALNSMKAEIDKIIVPSSGSNSSAQAANQTPKLGSAAITLSCAPIA